MEQGDLQVSLMPQRQNKWVSGWAGVSTPGPQVDLRWVCVREELLTLHITVMHTGETDTGRQTDGGELITL